MATPFTATLDAIVDLARAVLEDVSISHRDENETRAILKLTGTYRDYRIHLREVVRSNGTRKYAYYVIQSEDVVAGFDNASDAEALLLKYGDNFAKHRSEAVPHYHFNDKQNVALTDETTASSFLEWLTQEL